MKKELTVKDGAISFLLGFLICQLSVLAVSFFAVIFCSIFKISTNLTDFFNTATGYMICSIALNLGLVGVFILFNKNKDNKILTKPKHIKVLLYVLVAVISYLMLCPIINCIDNLLKNLNVEINSIPYQINTNGYFISLISLVLLPAICEELIFRGLIFKSLKSSGKTFAIIISSLMFAVFHMSIDQFVYPLLFGLLLGYVMNKENNLLYCITIHLVNNFLSLTFAYFNINLIFNHWTYILISIVLVVIFISVLLYLILKDNTNSSKSILNQTNKFYLIACSIIMVIVWLIINVAKFL